MIRGLVFAALHRARRKSPMRAIPWGAVLAEEAPADRMLRGNQAKRLLADPVLALAFETVERELTATWRRSALGAADEREAAYRQVWALEALKAKLTAFLGDAKMIEAEAKRKEQADRRTAERRERNL